MTYITDREKLMALIDNESLKKADAVVLLEGDGFDRIPVTVDLYKKGWAKKIVVSGDQRNIPCGSHHAWLMLPHILKKGVPKKDIIMEDKSQHTQEQAIEVMKLVKKNKWKKILLVGSHYHQYRAFLTFLKEMKNQRLKIQIINAPDRGAPWFKKNKWGRRIDLLDGEFERIEKCSKLGHTATFEEGIKYQEWKEKQK